jgi:hypothetical protein
LTQIQRFSAKRSASLRHIRVTSKYELKQRVMPRTEDFNRYPVIHAWLPVAGEQGRTVAVDLAESARPVLSATIAAV